MIMREALAQAALALPLCKPNPAVGCVIAAPDGRSLAIGHTQQVGGPHAEIMALRDAAASGHSVQGATLYVTLEPCAHQGRTGPCCEAIIGSGIKKVVASLQDPNPLVAGKGFERLRAAGIAVEIGDGAAQSRELNLGFFSRMIRQRPWVRMKLAASLDGQTALPNGQSQWITGDAARSDGHAWRAASCAVLTGIGTVLADNPRLDVRLAQTARQPSLVVVDSQLQSPLDALIFEAKRPLFIYASEQNDQKKAALEARGAIVTYLPGPGNKVDLPAMLKDLALRHELNDLHVEAGHKLNGSFIREQLVDELLVYLAPKLLGTAQGMASFGPLQSLAEAATWRFLATDRIGDDLRIRARQTGCDVFA